MNVKSAHLMFQNAQCYNIFSAEDLLVLMF